MERDLPRGWVLPDAALHEIAQSRPRTREDLSRLASVPRATADRAGGEILKMLSEDSVVADDLIAEDGSRAGPEQLRRLKVLQQRLAALAGELGIQPEVLATRRELVALLVRQSLHTPLAAAL